LLDTFLRIQEFGVCIVFDDFSNGYASLSYLKKFPLDGLKIDRSFVLGLLANPDDAAIVSSTVGLSKQLGLFDFTPDAAVPAEIVDYQVDGLTVSAGTIEGVQFDLCIANSTPQNRDFSLLDHRHGDDRSGLCLECVCG
jgi:predicted signal transduction protein with EAL and GGDEF domain